MRTEAEWDAVWEQWHGLTDDERRRIIREINDDAIEAWRQIGEATAQAAESMRRFAAAYENL